VRIFRQFFRDLVYLRVLTSPFIQHEQDTATLFEEKPDTKRSFWVRLGYEDAFNVMTTYLLYRFQRRLKMFRKIKTLGRN
jgi:phosphoenolpyruvate carboxylase